MIGHATVRQRSLAYLAKQQLSDGSFSGWASPSSVDFTSAEKHPTIFFTALITNCLSNIVEGSDICNLAADFLVAHKSMQWSWNYWQRGDAAAAFQRYPDDLDDTACSLIALSRYRPTMIDGRVLGLIARQLIATETAPGGPYRTWLVDSKLPKVWQDVDIAVNANIGYFLSLHEVHVPGLEQYVEKGLETNKLISPYYCGPIPILYFLSRWYRGAQISKLQQYVSLELQSSEHKDNPLLLALLLNAANHLQLPKKLLEQTVSQLMTLYESDHWPSAALYYEPPINNKLYYAGSTALTTAFALEALEGYHKSAKVKAVALSEEHSAFTQKSILRTLQADSHSLEPQLKRRYRAYIRRLVRHDHDGQITNMAHQVAAACKRTIPEKTAHYLELASLHGWAAYTIFDDFLDDSPAPHNLSLATLCLRRCQSYFYQALPKMVKFQTLVQEVLDLVDSANTWELINARTAAHQGQLHLRELPSYDNLESLWQRSWGHMLAACGVMCALSYHLDSSEQQAFQSFFRHFLIARQLNDDAHDWENDLESGHLSAVVSWLLQGYSKLPFSLNLSNEIADLRLYFWESILDRVSDTIRAEIQAARQDLNNCPAIIDQQVFLSWLIPLEQSVEMALQERQQAQRFINSYKNREIIH